MYSIEPQTTSALQAFDQKRAESNETWNISQETGIFLHTLIQIHQSNTILEIGTSTGYSGTYLADAAKKTGGHVYTVESHDERFTQATAFFQKAGVSEVITQIKGHAPEVFTELNIQVDFVFLDATKYEHISYVQALLPLLNPNAVIITDNILSHKEEMQEFVEFMDECGEFENSVVNIGTGLLISLKLKSKN